MVVMVVRLTRRNENEEMVVNPHSGSNNSYQMLVGVVSPTNAYHNYNIFAMLCYFITIWE